MNIIRQSRDYTKKELYQIAHNKHTSLKDVPTDCILHMTDFVQYEDDKNTQVLVMFVSEGDTTTTVSTTSPTAIRCLAEAVEFFESSILDLGLRRSTSKAGRTFMTLEVI